MSLTASSPLLHAGLPGWNFLAGPTAEAICEVGAPAQAQPRPAKGGGGGQVVEAEALGAWPEGLSQLGQTFLYGCSGG